MCIKMCQVEHQILLFKVFFSRNLMRCLLVLVTSPALVLRIPQFLLARFPCLVNPGHSTRVNALVYVEPEFHVCCFNPKNCSMGIPNNLFNPQLLNVNSCNFLRFYAFFSQHFLVARIKLYRL